MIKIKPIRQKVRTDFDNGREWGVYNIGYSDGWLDAVAHLKEVR